MRYMYALGQLSDTDDTFLRHHIKNYLSTLSRYQRLLLSLVLSRSYVISRHCV